MTLVIIISALAAFLVLLVLLFFFLRLNVSLFVHNKDVLVKVGGIKVYDSAKPEKKKQKKVETKDEKFEKNYKSGKQVINFIRTLLDDKNDDLLLILRYIKKTFDVKRLDIALEYGFSEAAVTGIAGGAIWMAVAGVCSYVQRYIDLKNYLNVAVKPNYDEKIFDFNLCFVFRIRICNLAKTMRYILRFKENLKGGR